WRLLFDNAGPRVPWCPRFLMASFPVKRARNRAGFEPRPRDGMTRRVGAYRLGADVASRVRAGHPWIFRDALGTRELTEPTGTLVEILSGNRDFIARGLVDQDHPVAVRVVTHDPREPVAPG